MERMKKQQNIKAGRTFRYRLQGLIFTLVLLLQCLFSAGCVQHDIVKIGVQKDTRLQLLAEMASLMLEEKGIDSEIIEIDDGLTTIHSALLGGTLDFYPSYTGEGWTEILNHEDVYRSHKSSQLKKEYGEMGVSWIGISPVFGYYTLAVTEETAEKYDLKTLSDLAADSRYLKLGATSNYIERRDGLHLLQDEYGMSFQTTRILQEDELVKALKDGDVDVIPLRTNDGRLFESGIRVMTDDRMLLPESSAGFVVSDAFEQKEAEAKSVLEALNSVTSRELIEMNARVDLDKESPEAVARDYLQKKGLIP